MNNKRMMSFNVIVINNEKHKNSSDGAQKIYAGSYG